MQKLCTEESNRKSFSSKEKRGGGGGAWGRGLLCEKKRVLGEFGAVFWWVLMKLLEINVSVLAVL